LGGLCKTTSAGCLEETVTREEIDGRGSIHGKRRQPHGSEWDCHRYFRDRQRDRFWNLWRIRRGMAAARESRIHANASLAADGADSQGGAGRRAQGPAQGEIHRTLVAVE